MEYSVGDMVIHPRHGAGQITGVKHKELVEGFKHYYVLEILGNNSVVYVPIRKMSELGVRPVMPKKRLKKVLDVLGRDPNHLPEDNGERQVQVRDKIRMGGPLEIAEAVRDLAWLEHSDRLNKADSDLLAWGRRLLVSEMSLVGKLDDVEASQMIDDALRAAIASKSDSDTE